MLESKMKLFYDKLNSYEKDLPSIINIQRRIRQRLKEKQLAQYGEGFFDKQLCQNSEDFYTFENYNDISDDYFFSYKDVHNKVYYFDIRSFYKLLNSNKNPIKNLF